MKNNRFFLALTVITGLFTGNAVAGDYSFDFVASGYEVNGTFTTSDTLNAVNGYDIVGISGEVTGLGGGDITSLVLNPNQPYPTVNYGFSYDNVLFPAAAQKLDINGVLFTTTSGAIWNLWGNSATDYQLYSYGPVAVDVHSTSLFMVAVPANIMAAVPEPQTYAMMIVGLGLLGFVARRRKQRAV